MQQIILIFHILICLSLIGLVLVQHGKGADIGAAFGSGASQTLFGSRGTASFLFKLTAFLAALFFVTSLLLSYLAGNRFHQVQDSVLPVPSTQVIPVSTPSSGGSPGPTTTGTTDATTPTNTGSPSPQ